MPTVVRPYCGDTNFLGAPIEIGAFTFCREQHEGSHCGAGIVRALGVCIAPGCGAKWKQRWTISAVTSYRQSRLANEAKAVA